MEKPPMCRICLTKNVRMHVVVNRNLHELYEKLTDIPFVTEDSRPILACFYCCAKLNQSYCLLKQCLRAEALFAQMMNEDYEPNPFINHNHFEVFSGLIKSPIEHISITDECQIESIAIKEELPVVYKGLDDIIEPKEEPQSDELEPDVDNIYLNVADIRPNHSESDLEYDVPLMTIKTEVQEEQEVSRKKRRARETKNLEPDLDNSCLNVADIRPNHSESDFEYDVPLMTIKTEVEEEQEVSQKKQRTRKTKGVIVAKKPKLDVRRTKQEDAITAEKTKKDKSDSNVIRAIAKQTSKPCTYFKEPYTFDQRSLNRVKKIKQHTRTKNCEKQNHDIYQRSFNHKGDSTKLIRINTGEKPYKCDFCQRSFNKKCHLSDHIRIHTDDKPYKCDFCQRSFSEKGKLTKHIRVHTGEKPYKCDICHCCFSQKSSLPTHMRIHTGEKPFKCYICQRSFSDKSHLTDHIRIHTGEKPYKCIVCQRSFSEKGSLTKHMRIHTGEKPFKCDVCQRSFSEKGSLTKHIRIHTGEKPYKCDVCQLSFRVRCSLTKHIRIHTGEKPYECDICLRSFSERGSLTKHIRIHR